MARSSPPRPRNGDDPVLDGWSGDRYGLLRQAALVLWLTALSASPVLAHGFGPITTLKIPGGGAPNPPALPLTLPRDFNNACDRTAYGVRTAPPSLPFNLSYEARDSSSDTVLATTVTPVGCPP